MYGVSPLVFTEAGSRPYLLGRYAKIICGAGGRERKAQRQHQTSLFTGRSVDSRLCDLNPLNSMHVYHYASINFVQVSQFDPSRSIARHPTGSGVRSRLSAKSHAQAAVTAAASCPVSPGRAGLPCLMTESLCQGTETLREANEACATSHYWSRELKRLQDAQPMMTVLPKQVDCHWPEPPAPPAPPRPPPMPAPPGPPWPPPGPLPL